MRWSAFWISGLLACSGGTDTKGEDTDANDTDTGEPTDTEPEEPVVLGGVVRDASGALMTDGIRVQFCPDANCYNADLDGAGGYAFRGLNAMWGAFEVAVLDEGSNLSTAFAPIRVTADLRTMDVVLPTLSAKKTLPGTAEWLEVADGLELQLAAGELVKPSPFDDDATAVAGAKVAAEDRLPTDEITGTVLAMYYLVPFNHTHAGIPVRLADTFESAEENLELWYGDYAAKAWVKVGVMTSDGSGHLAPSGTLPKLTTLIVVKP